MVTSSRLSAIAVLNAHAQGAHYVLDLSSHPEDQPIVERFLDGSQRPAWEFRIGTAHDVLNQALEVGPLGDVVFRRDLPLIEFPAHKHHQACRDGSNVSPSGDDWRHLEHDW